VDVAASIEGQAIPLQGVNPEERSSKMMSLNVAFDNQTFVKVKK
jgi:hypothetical protein